MVSESFLGFVMPVKDKIFQKNEEIPDPIIQEPSLKIIKNR